MKTFTQFLQEAEDAPLLTKEQIAALWLKVMPHSISDIGGKDPIFCDFYIAKDKTEVSNSIMRNDPLAYSAKYNDDGSFEESAILMYVKPEEGNTNAFGKVKLRKKTIKNATEAKILARFKEVRKFIMDNADQLTPQKFDIKTK